LKREPPSSRGNLSRLRDRGCQIVYPVHLNPNIQGPVYRVLGNRPNILLTPPLDYATLAHLIKRTQFVTTDSGGLQEEAPSLGKPVLVLREVTERPEAVQAGTVKAGGDGPGADRIRGGATLGRPGGVRTDGAGGESVWGRARERENCGIPGGGRRCKSFKEKGWDG
jgi:UDP-N-acetylglucosamine 2-epimerase